MRNSTEKKLDALIDALGFDVERVETLQSADRRRSVLATGVMLEPEFIYDYKLIKREAEIKGDRDYIYKADLLKALAAALQGGAISREEYLSKIEGIK